MTEIRKPDLAPVWEQLSALYRMARPDWVAADVKAGAAEEGTSSSPTAAAAVAACQSAGVPFADAFAEAVRTIRAIDGTPRELRDLARRRARSEALAGPGLTREEREELRASYLAACDAASRRFGTRETGPQPALRDSGPIESLREGHDP